MALEFSRCVEELVATKVFITSTDGFIDISALGVAGDGGVITLGARTIRLDSDHGQVAMGHAAKGGSAISVRAAGDGASIVLGVPGSEKSALVSLSEGGMTLVYGPADHLGTIKMLDKSIELAMGPSGGRVVVSDHAVTLQVGDASLTLTADGLVSRCGGKVHNLTPEGTPERHTTL
jgi:hypothetical protein